jgi:hypothetical protein
MLKSAPLILGLAFLVANASARIGEDLEECEKRYGLVVESVSEDRLEKPAMTYKFSKGGFEVLATLAGGKVVALQFTSLSRDVLMQPEQLTPEQISSFLLRNAGSWSVPKSFPPYTSWESGDGKLFAQYNKESKTLTICAKDVSDPFVHRQGTAPDDF